MQKVIFYGGVNQGKLKLDRLGVFETYIGSLPEGLRVELCLQKEQEDVTLSQYKYYYSCIVSPLSEHTGYLKDEIDGILSRKLLTQNAGTEREYVKSKSKCNREGLAAFIDKAIMLAAELGVVVCPPNRFWRQTK